MIRHVVLFTFRPDVTAEQVAELGTALDELVTSQPEVVGYRHGPDVGLADGNADYALVGDFASVADYETYRDHPRHRAFIDDHVVGAVVSRVAVQFDGDDVVGPA